jgi:L-ascorbate metabolism protein UlaG (beta-lactamase superfamily)
MRIKWLGHSCFLIVGESGVRIVTDPYEPGGSGGEGVTMRQEGADVVLVSHEHHDHNYVRAVLGNPEVVKASKSVREVSFQVLDVFHDTRGGKERGANRVFSFELEGMSVCHLGDLGHILSEKEAQALGKPDVLFIPIGGVYTSSILIDARQATEVLEQLQPRVAIPMHYKTSEGGFSLAGVDDFLMDKHNVEQVSGSEIVITRSTLPEKTKIIVLEPER